MGAGSNRRRPVRRREGGRLTHAEAALFHTAMNGTKRLKRSDSPPITDASASPDNEKSIPGKACAKTPERTPALPDRAPALPELHAGVATGLDGRTMERLRRGRLRPDATLDLHGMTRDEARTALDDFLARAQKKGQRCVIVVTGRGLRSEGGGVLRAELPHWLNLPPNRGRILGFAQAQPKDGGAGATYVLLKRRRD